MSTEQTHTSGIDTLGQCPAARLAISQGRSAAWAVWLDWEEIEKHNRTDDCWIVIDGFVYDVTEWVDRHPRRADHLGHRGGGLLDVIPQFAFERREPTAGAVPDRPGAQLLPDRLAASEFLTTLKRRVHDYLPVNRVRHRQTLALRPQVILSILAFLACWYLTYFRGYWLLVVPMGLISCTALIGGFAHEYCHSLLTRGDNRRNFTSGLCGSVWPILFPFMPEKYFQYEHFQHHIGPMDPRIGLRGLRTAPVPTPRPGDPVAVVLPLPEVLCTAIYAFYITIQVVEGYLTPYFRRRQFRGDPSFGLMVYIAPLISAVFHVAIPVAIRGLEGLGRAVPRL